MSDIERKDEEPEVEGHLSDDVERQAHPAPERLPHGRTGRPFAEGEEEGAEVEGHYMRSGPERQGRGPERLSS